MINSVNGLLPICHRAITWSSDNCSFINWALTKNSVNFFHVGSQIFPFITFSFIVDWLDCDHEINTLDGHSGIDNKDQIHLSAQPYWKLTWLVWLTILKLTSSLICSWGFTKVLQIPLQICMDAYYLHIIFLLFWMQKVPAWIFCSMIGTCTKS